MYTSILNTDRTLSMTTPIDLAPTVRIFLVMVSATLVLALVLLPLSNKIYAMEDEGQQQKYLLILVTAVLYIVYIEIDSVLAVVSMLIHIITCGTSDEIIRLVIMPFVVCFSTRYITRNKKR